MITIGRLVAFGSAAGLALALGAGGASAEEVAADAGAGASAQATVSASAKVPVSAPSASVKTNRGTYLTPAIAAGTAVEVSVQVHAQVAAAAGATVAVTTSDPGKAVEIAGPTQEGNKQCIRAQVRFDARVVASGYADAAAAANALAEGTVGTTVQVRVGDKVIAVSSQTAATTATPDAGDGTEKEGTDTREVSVNEPVEICIDLPVPAPEVDVDAEAEVIGACEVDANADAGLASVDGKALCLAVANAVVAASEGGVNAATAATEASADLVGTATS